MAKKLSEKVFDSVICHPWLSVFPYHFMEELISVIVPVYNVIIIWGGDYSQLRIKHLRKNSS